MWTDEMLKTWQDTYRLNMPKPGFYGSLDAIKACGNHPQLRHLSISNLKAFQRKVIGYAKIPYQPFESYVSFNRESFGTTYLKMKDLGDKFNRAWIHLEKLYSE
jgi:hypothetical protein